MMKIISHCRWFSCTYRRAILLSCVASYRNCVAHRVVELAVIDLVAADIKDGHTFSVGVQLSYMTDMGVGDTVMFTAVFCWTFPVRCARKLLQRLTPFTPMCSIQHPVTRLPGVVSYQHDSVTSAVFEMALAYFYFIGVMQPYHRSISQTAICPLGAGVVSYLFP